MTSYLHRESKQINLDRLNLRVINDEWNRIVGTEDDYATYQMFLQKHLSLSNEEAREIMKQQGMEGQYIEQELAKVIGPQEVAQIEIDSGKAVEEKGFMQGEPATPDVKIDLEIPTDQKIDLEKPPDQWMEEDSNK